ncbi:MAG TPA: universal stress protein [Candidatus Sulfotelmatobacter sp.]|nr:universal stress protein [Candidatus Sulfotelmatobacter sp.]
MFTKLLLAFDGSREGREALREATELARQLGAAVHLLSVVHLTPGELMGESALPGGLFDIEEAEMRKVLDEGVEALRGVGLTADGTLSRGPNPAQDIAQLAKRIGADLIVIGHREQGLLARLWSGSVGQQLIAHAPCSVLIAVAPSAAGGRASAAA